MMWIGRLGVVVALGLALTLTGTADAQDTARPDPPPFPEFTFKRSKPPAPGTDRRITIQIEETAPVPPLAPPKPDTEGAVTTTADWYWQVIAPSLADAGPGRIDAAERALAAAPADFGRRIPSMQVLNEIAATYGTLILTATVGTKVSPALALAVIGVESAGRPDAVSRAGATGLMQLMPDTAMRFGVTDATDPEQNIKGGVAYLDWLANRFSEDPVLMLAGYNAGEGSVRDHQGVPPFAETREYVPKVITAWMTAKALCLTPPVLASDGCVFVAGKR
ncbi:lytic transglycosylase domain-containing protein [Anianabacter salinae]|uniref:lytic transglycosylase domain-containing protein n=1 Tax=Anianabacter salinae TaxID=2851023 RepID=UPI00225E1958|nr:lytic transglycosylase domain-containing protein [Anianabacter salinae]MBV0911291.1 lytic transglycosylase domain-containing protein [Anianabacter salinae]